MRKTDHELPEDLRRDADSGPVIMPGYTLLNDEDWRRLTELVEETLEERDFWIAWERRKKGESEGATLDEFAEKYGL